MPLEVAQQWDQAAELVQPITDGAIQNMPLDDPELLEAIAQARNKQETEGLRSSEDISSLENPLARGVARIYLATRLSLQAVIETGLRHPEVAELLEFFPSEISERGDHEHVLDLEMDTIQNFAADLEQGWKHKEGSWNISSHIMELLDNADIVDLPYDHSIRTFLGEGIESAFCLDREMLDKIRANVTRRPRYKGDTRKTNP
tara:strand:- start:4 stop:612 length:609 start_codon:yes stop_codon:yes gene_type:complete